MSKPNLSEILGHAQESEVWSGMPYHEQEQYEAAYVLVVNIKNKEDLDVFADLIGQPQIKIDGKTHTKSIWHPRLVRGERGSSNWFVWVEVED